MSSVIVNIVKAVKVELDAHVFDPVITTERSYRPFYELEDLKSAVVCIVPWGMAQARETREALSFDAEISIAIMKKLSGSTNAEIDTMMDLVDEINAYITSATLSTYTNAKWISAINAPVYDENYLNVQNQFISQLKVTYKVVR